MSGALLAACLWAIAATVTAFLPMRLQFPPGILLLILAPFLLVWIGFDQGFWVAILASLGFLSMFRRPMIYFGRKLFKGDGGAA
ncbi:MAG: DUF2484 family protein [Paracoccaceae bacterium]